MGQQEILPFVSGWPYLCRLCQERVVQALHGCPSARTSRQSRSRRSNDPQPLSFCPDVNFSLHLDKVPTRVDMSCGLTKERAYGARNEWMSNHDECMASRRADDSAAEQGGRRHIGNVAEDDEVVGWNTLQGVSLRTARDYCATDLCSPAQHLGLALPPGDQRRLCTERGVDSSAA